MDAGTQTWVQYDVYAHDDAGRVTQVTDKVVGTTTGGDLAQCYTYDDLNRLASAWTEDASDACGSDGSQASTWAVADTGYSATWSYSLAGRITSASEAVVTSTGTETVDRDYTYGGDSPAAVTTLTSTGTAAPAAAGFTYDGAGRMITRDTASGTQTLTWDPTSNLVSVTGGGVNDTYLYDTTGQRVARVGATTATAYLGATEATDPDTNATVTGDVAATRFYSAGGATIAMRTATGISFLLGDVQGSATITIAAGDPATATVARNAYAPYGVTRGSDQLATDRGWLGQTEDNSTGLTYLNARYYDPVLARFISPDPLLSPADPNTLDPYAYAADNPVLFRDASGLCYGSKTSLAISDCMSGSQKTGATFNTAARTNAKKQSARLTAGMTVEPGGVPHKKKSPTSNAGSGPSKKGGTSGKSGLAYTTPKATMNFTPGTQQAPSGGQQGNFDWGTFTAGGINFVWGVNKTVNGGLETLALFGVIIPGGPEEAGSAVVATKGIYDLVTGPAKVFKGLKQMGYATTTPCAADCGAAGNARRLGWGVTPFAATLTEGMPALPEGLADVPGAGIYNNTRESWNENVTPRVRSFGERNNLLPPQEYRDDFDTWLDHLGGAA